MFNNQIPYIKTLGVEPLKYHQIKNYNKSIISYESHIVEKFQTSTFLDKRYPKLDMSRTCKNLDVKSLRLKKSWT